MKAKDYKPGMVGYPPGSMQTTEDQAKKNREAVQPTDYAALEEEVKAVYPDVELVFHKKNSYVDRKEDMFYIHKGDAYLGAVNVKDSTAYWIITAIEWYLYAYNLATERAEDRIINKLCDTFNLEKKEDGS